ncbi:GPW/gp25 family protein [Enterobacter kobei]|nr:GPW/gp25 family protein [Enterobacter kobei]
MKGMNARTGRPLSGNDHLRQSILNILTTPVGTRVLRRDYGSELPELVDAPVDAALIGRIRRATADALNRWEPRIRVTRVYVTGAGNGFIEIVIEGRSLESGAQFRTSGVRIT